MDLAYVYARDKNKDNIENLDLLLQYISEIRDFYNNTPPKCASLKSIGIEEAENLNVKVYPNPARDYIIVDVDPSDVMSLEIISTNGQTVLTKKMESGTEKIDISQLQKGAYLIRFSNAYALKYLRIIKF